jgi:hypothetical protein
MIDEDLRYDFLEPHLVYFLTDVLPLNLPLCRHNTRNDKHR